MPRFSRISWKSREEAEPPRIASRIEAAKRRRSVREMPGAPRQTWYCSVSLRWKRRPGFGVCDERRAELGRRASASAPRSSERWTSATSSSWSMFPAAATTTFAGA